MNMIRVPKTKRARIEFCSGYYDPKQLRKLTKERLYWVCLRVLERQRLGNGPRIDYTGFYPVDRES
jgi:hypothetical protein